MNKTTDDNNSSPLSDFMKEMRISSTNYRIVADNPRSKSLWPHREKSLDTADADKESQRWQATVNGSQSSGHKRASSFDEVFPLTPTEFSKSPLTRSFSGLINSPPCLPRRRESYDADENIGVSPLSKKLMEVITMGSPKSDEDRKSAAYSTKNDRKPMKARAA
jgi:hypothetical protein